MRNRGRRRRAWRNCTDTSILRSKTLSTYYTVYSLPAACDIPSPWFATVGAEARLEGPQAKMTEGGGLQRTVACVLQAGFPSSRMPACLCSTCVAGRI